MIFFDRLLVGGLRFVLNSVAQAVESELDDEKVLKEELLAAQMRHEMGELDDAGFAELEGALLARLRDIKARQQGAPQGAIGAGDPDEEGGGGGFSLDVSFSGDEHER